MIATKYGRNILGGIPSPNPSFPENVNVVTGTQEVEVRGKQLLNPENNQNNWGIVGSTSVSPAPRNNNKFFRSICTIWKD